MWGPKRTLALLALALVGFAPNAMAAKAGRPNSQAQRGVLDHELTRRSTRNTGTTRVIITLKPGATMPGELKKFVTVSHRRLGIINGQVVTIPNALLQKFASHPSVLQIDYDRPIGKLNFRTAVTIGSPAVHHGYGLTGAGVTVATIDSGIATWHDDLTNRTGTLYPYGNQRVSAFVDFVDGNPVPHDDQGHGTHVAGIIAGNGYDSLGQKAGVAPDANLVSLKVLDGNGNGTISNIIAAFDWIVANRQQYNIRVVNASVGAAIRESYFTDPLTLAAKHVVDAGVVVVVAAGNLGKNAAGLPQYGGITAPGNAPWVVTVGASSTMGTPDRADDTMASFSSRGPTFKDWGAKPDLVAPGAGTVSLAAPLSTFYTTKAQYLIPGSVSTPLVPYLTLSGTSMAAPVVTGTVALMLQANPSLTPNMVKAILEYTAQPYPGYDSLTQGAGFLNTLGAVQLAQFYATAHPGDPIPAQSMWSKRIIWGNHALAGGKLLPSANAFKVGTNWGAFKLDDLSNVVWGTAEDADVVWGTDDDGNVVWGTDAGDDSNVVWGTDCGGDDCDNVVWGTADDDNVVWGTSDDGDIVWGTSDDESVVWGTADDDNVVWGTDDDGNVVWGTDDGGNVVWGTVTGGQVTWYGANGTVRPIDWVSVVQSMTDEQVFLLLKTITTTLAPTVTTSGGTGSF